jgi:transcriptional regulator with GAF, ATPase, and Fis domain
MAKLNNLRRLSFLSSRMQGRLRPERLILETVCSKCAASEKLVLQRKKMPRVEQELDFGTMNLREAERILILRALDASGWVQSEAAKKLGITARALNYKISSHGITHKNWWGNTGAKSDD